MHAVARPRECQSVLPTEALTELYEIGVFDSLSGAGAHGVVVEPQSWRIGSRIVSRHRLRQRTEAVRRDYIARKRVADKSSSAVAAGRGRIIDRDQRTVRFPPL